MPNTGNNRNGGNSNNSGRPANPQKPSGKSAPSGKNVPSAKSAPSKGGKSEGLTKEKKELIAIAVFVLLMVLFTLCNFGLIGKLGEYISGFMFGVFGFLAYITPPCIIASFFIIRKYKDNKDVIKRFIAAVALYFLIAVICEMAKNAALDMEAYSFSTLYKNGYTRRCGGGLISGSIAYLIFKWMNYVGLVILLIIGFFISLVILTQGKLLDLCKKIFAAIKNLFNNSEAREIRQARREEARRQQNIENNRRLLEDKRRRQQEEEEDEEEDDKDSRNEVIETEAEDETLVRNKKHVPTPGFNENSEDYEDDSEESFEEYQNGQEKDEAGKKRENISLRERIERNKRKNKEIQKAKKKLRAEQREANEILKIVPPKDEQAVPTKYKQDMHEVFITDVEMFDDPAVSAADVPQAAVGVASAALGASSNGRANDDYSKANVKHEYNNFDAPGSSSNDMPSAYVRNRSTEYDGLVGSQSRNPMEKVKIKKQEINSVHKVVASDDFDSMDPDEKLYNNVTMIDEAPEGDDVSEGDGVSEGDDVSEIDDKNEAVSEENDPVTEVDDSSYDEDDIEISDYENSMTPGPSVFKPDFSKMDNVNSEDYDSIEEETEEADNETINSVKNDSPDHSDIQSSNINAETNNQPEMNSEAVKPAKPYQLPPLSLLKKGQGSSKGDQESLLKTKDNLQATLDNFNVAATVTEYTRGPSVTRFEIKLEPGTKVSKILSLADDIKLSLASADVRIEAPIPGKPAVGIEVPNTDVTGVMLRDLFEDEAYSESKASLGFAVGMNIGGEVIVSDIAKMPHVLIAGTTGSGKSVCINTLIMSLLYKYTPEEVQMILVDPKVVELSVYNGIPHMPVDVITDPKKASAALAWGVKEMEDRYKKFANLGVRDLKGYNDKIQTLPDERKANAFKLPKIVIIIDELADLMMTCGKEVEASICRLAQLARACGIHLVVATQRPSVDVITGLIKANMPSRIAFAVKQGVDSRTILDQTGAEKLLGKGDMLFYPQGKAKPERVQGAFVSDEEVLDVVEFIRSQKVPNAYAQEANLDLSVADENSSANEGGEKAADQTEATGNTRDELYAEAGRCVITSGKGSIGFLQRKLQIGFNRAARIMDSLSEDNVVGSESGTKAREILMSIEEFESFLEDNGIS